MTANPRRWFESRAGRGLPWTVGDASPGPWARWDRHFGSEGEIVELTEGDGSLSLIIRETNDYYRLLERGPQLNRLTYFFDESGLLEGLLVDSFERTMGLTEEFRAWARANRPGEISELLPEGDIDPSDPEGFRQLLNDWRRATGRNPIEKTYRPCALPDSLSWQRGLIPTSPFHC